MSKLALVKEIQNNTQEHYSRRIIEDIVNSYNSLIQTALLNHESFVIPGIGEFSVIETKPTKKYDMINKKSVDVPAKFRVKFRPYKYMKDAVNESESGEITAEPAF